MTATLALPMSAHELREAVRQARPFNPAKLDRVLRLDASRGLVEVQASTSWESLAAYLRPECPEVAALWTGLSSIGDSVATNAAGPDGRPTVAHIDSLTLVALDGEFRRISRIVNPELFRLAVGGHGLFGALYSVTLNLESLARTALDSQPSARLALGATSISTGTLIVLVAPEALEQFLTEARTRCGEWRVAIEGVEVRRTLPEAETLLRWARREYAEVSLRLPEPSVLGGCVRMNQLRRELIDSALAHGGSFPIASNLFATRAQTEACYPELREFLADKRRLDPAERFNNPWYRHYRSLLACPACEVRWS
jgi:hypothetical protein